MQRFPERRVSPEALAPGLRSRSGCFGGVGKGDGDNHEVCVSSPSLSVPTQRYVGVTSNLSARLLAHNAGASSHTSKYRPWKVVTYLGFQNDHRAVEFERYLKTGSGQAFANKRFW